MHRHVTLSTVFAVYLTASDWLRMRTTQVPEACFQVIASRAARIGVSTPSEPSKWRMAQIVAYVLKQSPTQDARPIHVFSVVCERNRVQHVQSLKRFGATTHVAFTSM